LKIFKVALGEGAITNSNRLSVVLHTFRQTP
jgi:hypothetical protein